MFEYGTFILFVVSYLLIILIALIIHFIFERKGTVTQPPIPSTATPECPNFESKALDHEALWKNIMWQKIRKHAKIITVKESKKLIDVDIMERAIREAAKEYVQSLSEDQNDKSA